MADLYATMKGLAYPTAVIVSGKGNAEAEAGGFKDVFDFIMSDSDHMRQTTFLHEMNKLLSEKQRRILLDGMAKEYAGTDGWLAYVEREVV